MLRSIRAFITLLILFSFAATPPHRSAAQSAPRVHRHSVSQIQSPKSTCSQATAERSALIRKAQKNRYLIRRVEFIGNERTADWVLRRRILLPEGNVFTRAILMKGLARVSTVKNIYPVHLNDVVVLLDDERKSIDLLICLKEGRPYLKASASNNRRYVLVVKGKAENR